MKYDTMLEISNRRRSIKSFKNNKVSREDIEKIVNVAIHAPSGFNSQPWEMVVIDDLDLKDTVSAIILDVIGERKIPKGFVNAPVFILLYGDTKTRERAPIAMRDNDAWWDFTFKTSLANAFMSMQLAASSLEIGTTWVSISRDPKVNSLTRKKLNVPDHLELFEMMAVGYTDTAPNAKDLRDSKSVIHYNDSFKE